MNEITLGQTVLRAAFGGDCLKFDGRKSQEIRERKMSRISDTGTLRPMHGKDLSVQLAGAALFISVARNEFMPAEGRF